MKAIPVEVADYLWRLGMEDREVLFPVFYALHDAMPDGYTLRLYFGMPCWVLPDRTTMDGTPLINAALTTGRLYLFGLARDPHRWEDLARACETTGKPVQVAGSRITFTTADDLDLVHIARAVAMLPATEFAKLCTSAQLSIQS